MMAINKIWIAAQANSPFFNGDVKRSGRSHNPAILDQLKQAVS